MRIALPPPWLLARALARVAASPRLAPSTAVFGLVTFAGINQIGLRARATRF